MQSNAGGPPAAREGEAAVAAPATEATPAAPAAAAATAGGIQAAQGAPATTAAVQQAPAVADQAPAAAQTAPSGADAGPTPAAPAPAAAPPGGGAVKDKEEPPANTATPGAAATTAPPAGPAKGKLDSAALTASLNKLPSAKPREREPLNVKDALSYLDQVKSKFANQADVYNDFLDIMKDFKTSVIDTPGVIDRVSSLFRNYPVLISDFNLFLPDGYRLDCHFDRGNPDRVTSIDVITPAGIQLLPPGRSSNLTGIRLPGMVEPTPITRHYRPASQKPVSKPAPPPPKPTAAVKPPAAAPAKPNPKRVIQTSSNMLGGRRPDPPGAQDSASASRPAEEDDRTAGPARPAGAVAQSQPQAPSQTTTPGGASRTATPTSAGGIAADKRPPIEFNHAISYVNKIKNRFISQPEIYKSFLDILQTYQKEQRPIQDVYAQVTKLFKGAPDLLDEFKQFLPDHSQQGNQGQQQQASAAVTAAAADSAVAAAAAAVATPSAASVPPAATTSAAAALERKKAQAAPPLIPAASQAVSRARVKPSGPPSVASDDVAGSIAGASGKRKRAPPGQEKAAAQVAQNDVANKGKGAANGKGKGKGAPPGVKDPPTISQQSTMRYEPAPGQSAAGLGYPQPILSYLPPGYTLPGTGPGATGQIPAPLAQETPEEKVFFDRIAEFIDDKFAYYEFLKLLNLYTQEIIDLPTLVSRAWLFLGSAPDLWLDFREVVGWKDGANVNGRVIENGEWIVENVPVIERRTADLTRCEAAGPSYRRLPKHEINMACSGRDSLCWEVLNDEWVSVMNMGSEEVFLASKKNPFEEALHRSEEERHEYDFHIEANLRTIALLEPIAARIASMDPEERINFRLKPGLGGQSKSIYQRIIKKVYGKEMGREVIQALHDNPCVSVPIMLARLKQKDEEWKRALREWNRVWREVDAKNFYRSLDHLGINFKALDKRYIASKALVNEIELMRRTELQRQISAPPRYRPTSPTYQLSFAISDENVLCDSLKLFLSYLDRAPGYHTTAERDRIEAFLRSLTSLVFAIPVSVLDSMLTPVQDDSRSVTASEDDDGMSDSAASSILDGPMHIRARTQTPSQSQTAAAKKTADLRKKAMKNATGESGKKGGRAEGDTPTSSRDSTPVPHTIATAMRMATPTPDAAVNGGGDTIMADADVQPSTGSDAQRLLEEPKDGQSTFKTDVPASAAGLDGMVGVETVQAATSDIAVPQPDTLAGGPVEATTTAPTPVTQQAVSDSIQTASETMQNGPAASTVYVPATAQEQVHQQQVGSGPASASGGDDQTQPNSSSSGSPSPALHNAQPRGEHQIRRFNFFCNTPYYCAIRLLQLLYSRLNTMKETARHLSSTTTKDALSNSAYTLYGKSNPRFNGQDVIAPTAMYDSMLEMCEKLFGGEIDQPAFEDGIRSLFGNKGYQVFTIDKLLSALVKTVWSLIDSNREAYSANGDIFKLLVDDRRYPTTAQAQQISYRTNAELAAGSDENLYRIEWMPRRHLLTFQILGKDEVLPEDEADLCKIWDRYVESFVNDEHTAGLTTSAAAIVKNAYIKRDLVKAKQSAASLPQLIARSELQSRICMRSYRMFWQTRTEDAMHRAWSHGTEEKMADVAAKRKERANKWLAAKEKELNPPAHEATSEPQADAQKEFAAPAKDTAAPATVTDAAETASSVPAIATTATPAEPTEKPESALGPEASEGKADQPASGSKAHQPADASVDPVSPETTAGDKEQAAAAAPGEPAGAALEPSTVGSAASEQKEQTAGDGDISMAEA